MLKYYFDVDRGVTTLSTGASNAALDSAQMNSTLGQSDSINIQLTNSDASVYTKIPANYVARFLVDKDYENPGVPLPLGNTNWTLATGSEYSIPFTIGTPTTVTFDGTEATLGSIGTLTAGQYGYASNKIYVRLSDSTNPNTKAEDYVLVTVANPSATPLAIESSSDVFNLPLSWLGSNGVYRDPVITNGELTFTVNSNTINFYNKLGNANSVNGFAEVQFFDTTKFVFKIKIPKYIMTNRLLTSGENPVELVGVDVYTKAESDGRYVRKLETFVSGGLMAFDAAGNSANAGYLATDLTRLPTANEKAALTASNTPSGSNAYATALDLAAFAGGMIIKGNWDASTNTPDITGTTTVGWAWIVSVAGTTTLGSITEEAVSDIVVKTTDDWAKIDNSESYKVKLNAGDTTPGYLVDKLQTGPIDGIQFNNNLSSTPSHVEGLTFYDKENKCLAYMPDVSGSIMQIGQEVWVRVYNNTGSQINNGQVCYINGAYSGYPTVGLANAASAATCLSTIGICTNNIANNSYGFITRVGIVGGLDTSIYTAGTTLYLSDTVAGNFTSTKTLNPNSYIVYIGHVASVDVSIGRVLADTNITNEAQVNELVKLNSDSYLFGGMKNKTDSVVSVNSGTLEVTVSPAVDMFDVYVEGERYIYTTTQTVSFTDTEGLWYVYFDSTGIKATQTYSPNIYLKYAVVIIFYWDATNNAVLVDPMDERHGINMDGSSHLYLHTKVGTFCRSGCGITNLITNGGGSLATHAQFGVATGVVVDEDIESTTYTVASTVGYPVLYLSGTNWRVTNRTGYGFLNDGTTGRVAYNSSGTQVAAGDNTFVLCHVFGITGYNNSSTNYYQGIVCIQGQANYATLSLASAAAQTEIKNIVAGQLPLTEMAPIATLVLQTRDVYTNTVNAQFVTLSDGTSYINWVGTGIREAASVGGGGSGGSTTSVAATDVTVDASSFTNITGTNAQTVFDSIDDLMGTLGTGTQQTLTDNTANYYIACAIASCRVVVVAWYVTDGTNYQYYRTRMVHNGSTVLVSSDYIFQGTEFLPAKIDVDGDINSGNMRLKVTLSSVGSNLTAVLKTVSTLKVTV